MSKNAKSPITTNETLPPFNKGDIVHFKKERIAKYGKEGGSYEEYKFNLNHRYQIVRLYNADCCGVTNLEDGTTHFITSMYEYLISVEDWREKKLKQLGV